MLRFLLLLLLPFAAACEPVSYLALGDSYTIGQSVPSAERWPEQLVDRLRGQYAVIDRPLTIAQTGWTVAELDRGIDAAAPQGEFGLVTLLIGVNDQFRGGTVEAYRPSVRAMLGRAIGFAGGHACKVVVLSIPDYGATPFGARNDPARIGLELDAFNAAARAETEAAGARFVDITDISRRAPAEPGLVARDGLHPSGQMYAEWVERALPITRQALACAAGRVAEDGR